MTIKIVDLFAGIGGIRLGFEQACKELGKKVKCVLTSEIKTHAITVYQQNHNGDINGDVTKIKNEDIPDFDILLAGFPCQAFSSAGKREGFLDTRGTMFFEVERFLKEKRPYGFILENVPGLVTHDRKDRKDKIGRTFTTMLNSLNKLGYKVSWKLINPTDFNIPQERIRIYIIGTLTNIINLNELNKSNTKPKLSNILEKDKDKLDIDFTRKLLEKYQINELYGKSIKDKRGGPNNIHSWELSIKGNVSEIGIKLLNTLLKERRKKQWAIQKNIVWMDGMPLTLDEIYTFFKDISKKDLQNLLNKLVAQGYIVFEHPKNLFEKEINGKIKKLRIRDETKPKGYNIVTGKLSFPISKILDPNGTAPTIVATDVEKLAVPDGKYIRRLTNLELLRLFGYPDNFKINNISKRKFLDLMGNTVVVPVIKEISLLILKSMSRNSK